MKYWIIIITAISLMSCDTSELERSDKGGKGQKPIKKNAATDPNKGNLDGAHEVIGEKELANGIKIKWFSHGNGELIKNGDMVNIDYKVYLENGEIIDGNHLRNLKSFPFMVGFQMQTKSWDMALREMKVGDFAEIFIPADQMRGDKEIIGLIPKNSNNILKIRVIDYNKPTRVVDGTRIWLMNENKSNTMFFGDKKEISFHIWASSPSNPLYFNTEWENNPYKYKTTDSGLVPGLRKALINAKKADLILVHVPSKEAYGTKGFQDLVKPDEDLLYRVLVMDVYNK